jgi:hypothetical protein
MQGGAECDMGATNLDAESLRQLVVETVLRPEFRRGTFGGRVFRAAGPRPWVRVVVRPVELRGQRHVQFAYFDSKKCFTKNYLADEIPARTREILDAGFSGIHLNTGGEELDIRTTKKGKILLGRRKARDSDAGPLEPHNRVKDVPLPVDTAARLLELLGILTPEGRVRHSMRAKYTQINEFLKHLLVAVDEAGLRSAERPLEILDCGCGLSYLTLSAHYYLNEKLGVPARILGVDVNDDVIRKSVERADQLGTAGLAFACERIDAVGARPDIVLALHACDTATDEAIARAVTGEAKILLSVPCCHHALNKAIRPEGPAAVLRPLLRHGILHQRSADLVTDGFRALALRIMGYRTEVVEFVSPEHTARNLMIRAVRGAPVGEESFVREYCQMCQFWGVRPYIETVLGERFRNLVANGR